MATRPRATAAAARRWNRNARLYDLLTEPMEAMMGFTAARTKVFRRATGRRMLEVGAGTGRNLAYHQRPSLAVVTDVSEAMLARARAKAGAASPVHFVVCDAEDLPFRDGAFDVVAATCVFCSVPDPVRGLAEARRVLRGGGEAVLLEHMRPAGLLGRLFDLLDPVVSRLLGPHINRRTLESIRRASFVLAETTDVRRDWVKVIVARPSAPAGARGGGEPPSFAR